MQTEIEFQLEGADVDDIEQVKFLLNFIQAGIKVLSARFMMLLSLVLTFGIFGYAICNPDGWRFGIATTFAVLVFLPTVFLEFKEK